ncbi:haloacid dehalogenase type II [Georgenia sp. EYE_87]|uniref:haloacid dehalogenase type II n=1 Tax=Georgenia sp. EYE_87 TaxID=2853448 RepID=UPI0020061E5D|nr:haloacid dehalogenase type II [Georgenia sp. EYE_87]MCK6209627.1 haloacid dehalogenase type II [Georgenia sp. EYE_87]
MRPSVIVFDVNETLSDMSPMGERFAEVGAPAELAKLWFAALLRDGFALAATGQNVPFADVAAEVLRPLLRAAGVTGDGAVRQILGAMASLELHPDVAEGVRTLAARGYRLLTLTNGSAQVAEKLLTGAGLRELFDSLLSVEDAPAWKPARAAYEHAATVSGTAPEEMVLVAVHPWDIHGAARAGMRTAWIDRAGTTYPGHFTAPDHTVTAVTDLPAALADRAPAA